MKTTKKILVAALAIFTSLTAVAQTTVINITGATAFRASANNAILNMLENVEYAYTGNQQLGGANRAIFKGTLAGVPGETIIRTSWSGSAGGVRDILQANPVQLLVVETPTSAAGLLIDNPTFEFEIAKFAFSDVAQVATPTPTPALEGTPVGVVPFMFVASASAPETLNNMTDQLFDALYSTGSIPLSMMTGDAADAGVTVLAVGRNASSGTRITMLAETQFGFARSVQQWQANTVDGQIQPDTLEFVGNGGYSSNSFIRNLVLGRSDLFETPVVIVSYLTISDALFVIENGARELTYNGVRYSEEAVQSGQYSLWGYQQFYNTPGLSASELVFRTALINTIPTTMGTAGIPIPDMRVDRLGGDGGIIVPQE